MTKIPLAFVLNYRNNVDSISNRGLWREGTKQAACYKSILISIKLQLGTRYQRLVVVLNEGAQANSRLESSGAAHHHKKERTRSDVKVIIKKKNKEEECNEGGSKQQDVHGNHVSGFHRPLEMNRDAGC